MFGNHRFALLPLALAITASAHSQQVTPARSPFGIVSGHVYCGDTGAPARLATVMLQLAKDIDSVPADAKAGSAIHMNSVQTGLDGSFSMQRVPPGSYLVFVSLPGYISPFTALAASLNEMRDPDAQLKRQILQSVPRVNVQPTAPANVEVRLERGASIAGSVRFDDGSPAIGIAVRPLRRRGTAWIPIALNGYAVNADTVTNDQGEYRFAGLPSGEYIVQADLELVNGMYDVGRDFGGSSSTTTQYSLSVFNGGVTQAKNAKPVPLKPGDDRPGEDIEVPLSKLHRLTGTLVAERDGHSLNGGKVELLNADDLTPVASAKVTKEESAFLFNFVPEGAYVLSVTGAADVNYTETMLPPGSMPPTYEKETVLHRYATAKQPIQVDRDTDSVNIVVKEESAGNRATP